MNSSSGSPLLFSGSSRMLNKLPPVQSSITMTFPLPSCSSSMARSLTIFSCFTFFKTSNSLICTSWGLIWLNWLNVFTATASPVCWKHQINRILKNFRKLKVEIQQIYTLLTPWKTAPVAPLPKTLVVHHTKLAEPRRNDIFWFLPILMKDLGLTEKISLFFGSIR